MATSIDGYFFSSSNTCPGLGGWECDPPHACARDTNTGRIYCCNWDTNSAESVCWGQTTVCATDGSTITCERNGATWCCQSETEDCTQLSWQSNACWNKGENALGARSSQAADSIYSSLSLANPSASTWPFDPESGRATGGTYSGSSSTYSDPSLTPGATGASESGSSASPRASSSRGISRGAIGGIVVGAVAVITILAGLVGYFLRKRRQQGTAWPRRTQEKDTGISSGPYPSDPQEGDHGVSEIGVSETGHTGVAELGYQAQPSQSIYEVDGKGVRRQELPAAP